MKIVIRQILFVLVSLVLMTSGANADSSRRLHGTQAKHYDSSPPHSRGIYRHRLQHRAIDARLEDLQQQIDGIESTPGPQGPQGDPGPQGPPGVVSVMLLPHLDTYFGELDFFNRFPRESFDAIECSAAVGGSMTVTIGSNQSEGVGFIGRDAISELGHYFVAIRSHKKLDVDGIVGPKTLVRINIHGSEDVFSGEAVRAGLAAVEDGAFIYVVELMPSAHRLKRNRRYRSFQEVTTQDIVKQVLGDSGISLMWFAGSAGELHEFVLQHNETDLDFVTRLLEDAGMHFYFDDADNLYVSDDAGANLTAAGLTYSGHLPASQSGPQLLTMNAAKGIPRSEFRVGTYQPLSSSPDFEANASVGGLAIGHDYEFLFDRSREAIDRRAQINRDISISAASMFRGSSNSPSLRAGHVVSVDGIGGAFSGRYLVTEVEHVAIVNAEENCVSYANRFDATDQLASFRPPRKTPRPVAHGITTAIVTGPAGETVFTDEFGRIKVKFHWDDSSSAWLRVMQMNTGGPAFIPEIGDEVVVAFLDGDPDQPVVIGSLYNARDMPPPR